MSQPASPKSPETTYPSLTLNDDLATAFLKENEVVLGDEIEVPAKFRVSGLRDDNYGSSVTLDVLEIGEGEKDESAEEEAGEEKESSNPAIAGMIAKMMSDKKGKANAD